MYRLKVTSQKKLFIQ